MRSRKLAVQLGLVRDGAAVDAQFAWGGGSRGMARLGAAEQGLEMSFSRDTEATCGFTSLAVGRMPASYRTPHSKVVGNARQELATRPTGLAEGDEGEEVVVAEGLVGDTLDQVAALVADLDEDTCRPRRGTPATVRPYT